MRTRLLAFCLIWMPAGIVASEARVQPQVQQTEPVLIREVEPKYTSEALRRHLQGKVGLEIVVLEDGAIGDAKVVKSLDGVYGLDANAVTAVKQWQFKPATLNGKAVRKAITVEALFHIHVPPEPSFNVTPDDPFARGVHRLGEVNLTPPMSLWSPGWPVFAEDMARGPKEPIDLIVLEDGTVGRARLAHDAFGPPAISDKELIDKLKDWRFKPARVGDQPVPVLIRVEMVIVR